MIEKKKAMIYPYNRQFVPVLRHRHLLREYEIVSIVSPESFQLGEKDAGIVDMGELIGLTVENNFEEALQCCDAVIFADWLELYSVGQLVPKRVLQAIEAGKNIICAYTMDDQKRENIENLCREKKLDFRYLGNGSIHFNRDQVKISKEVLLDITTPVVFVMSEMENANKFEIQLSLRDEFLQKGYKVAQIGTRSYCGLLGFHSFPEFMYSLSFHESEKVVLFNNFVKKIENTEKPDVIIIGIPGAIMPYNRRFTNKFGILAYEIACAVMPDAVVFSVLYNKYTEKFFKRLNDTTTYKFGFEIDCFNISNNMFEVTDSEISEMNVYTTIDAQFVNKKKMEHNYPGYSLFNVLDSNDAKSMAECIIDRLSGQGYSQII